MLIMMIGVIREDVFVHYSTEVEHSLPLFRRFFPYTSMSAFR